MDQLKNKRILFLYPYGYWPANPNCVSFIERCEKDGIPFDLVCPSALNCRGDGKAISEWAWLVRRLFFSAIKQSFRRPWKTPIIWKTLLHFYDLKHRIKNGRYSSIVTCDATGLGLLQRMALKQTVPIIYLSYHILFRSELKTRNEQILARRESQMIQSVTLALSQDESRKKLIAAELNLPEEKIQCIPVAPEDRFKKKDSLAPSNSSKMILYCGNIEKWNIEEVLNSISESIPAGYHLRIHTHFQPPKSFSASHFLFSLRRN
ncbi:hypothetical protein EBT16_10930 [bacterium]|nr:hypothetical protein [bacterium]